MPILTGMGRFFLQLGIALFILSNIYIVLFNAYGFPVHPVMGVMAKILPAVGLASAVSGAIYVFGRAFVPQIAQAAAYSVYITLFVGAVSSIAMVVQMLLSLLPLSGAITAGLTAVVAGIVSASIYYYMATRISGLPPE